MCNVIKNSDSKKCKKKERVSVAEVEYGEEMKRKEFHGFGDREVPPGCPIEAGLGGYTCCGTASAGYIGYGTTPIPDMAFISCHCG